LVYIRPRYPKVTGVSDQTYGLFFTCSRSRHVFYEKCNLRALLIENGYII